MIIDYSTSRPSIATLKGAGVTAAGRYIGWDSVPGFSSIGKNISRGEAEELTSNGIAVFLAFEYGADAAASGSPQGHSDAQLAVQQLAELAAPPNMAVYFAVDFDMPDYAPSLRDTPANARAKLGPVGAYFQAINNLKAAFEVGVYGGYYTVKRVLDAGLATKAWQATAWSGGQQDSRAVLYQVTAAPPISGADIDIRANIAAGTDYGQWPRPGSKASAPPAPSPTTLTASQTGAIVGLLPVLSSGMEDKNLPYEYITRLQALLKDVYGYPVVVDGVFGPSTLAAVKQVQSRYKLTQDGVVGALTWTPVITGS